MLNSFIVPLTWLIHLYLFCVIAWAIMSTLVSFNIINGYQPLVQKIMRVLNRLVQPALRPIQRFMPDLGGIDLSPIILILILSALPQFLLSVIDVRHGYLAIINLVRALLTLYIYCVGIYATLGALINFKLVNPYQPLVQVMLAALRGLCNPLVIPLRKWIRPVGRLDLAPFVLLIGLLLLNHALMQLM